MSVAVAMAACLTAVGSVSAQQSGPEDERFSGVYLGAGGGWGDFSSGGNGGYGEFFLGARAQNDNGLVYGIEAVGGLVEATDTVGEDVVLFDFDGYASVLAKVGYTSNNKLLVYGGAGYTSVDVIDQTGDSDTSGGIMGEAGIEYMASSWFGLRLRAQYHAVSDDSDITSVGAALLFSF